MEQAISRDIPVKESALQINPVVFDELTFKRLSNKHFGESTVQLKIGQIIQKLKDSSHCFHKKMSALLLLQNNAISQRPKKKIMP